MRNVRTLSAIIKHVWSEPKFVAQIQWHHEHPDPVSQIFAQLGSQPASKSDADVRAWLESAQDEVVEVEIHQPPDWDWWEPRHDQPWRRKQARDREFEERFGRSVRGPV